VWSLFQDRTRQEVEFAPPWMGSRHVLKQGPRHLGAHADKMTQCKTEMHRFSATTPALLYLLHPCSRAHQLAHGVPFIPQSTFSTDSPQPRLASRRVPRSPGWLLDGFPVSPSLTFSHLLSPWPCAKQRVQLKCAAPTHACARGVPYILYITRHNR